jgi:8-oxo-dGTP pyrophosphatase MutT (NUDIX family)
MPQKYKVFFNHTRVYFVKTHFVTPANAKKLQNPDKQELLNLAHRYIESETRDAIYILCDDVKSTWKLFGSVFKKKKAAGGLVINDKNEFLFIKRKGLWDLPKGHIEKGEKTRDTAVREVSEECGITNLNIDYKITKTYHTYWLKGRMILKPCTWYLMHYNGSEPLIPQEKEGITDVFWVKANELQDYCKNSFPSIRSVFKVATGFDPCALTATN